MIKDRPHRLDLIYINQPLYYVTFATRDRKESHHLMALRLFWSNTVTARLPSSISPLGRYVIMPDHVHLFVRGDRKFTLSSWIGGVKRAMSVTLESPKLWQPGSFDHVLRTNESYG